MSAKWKRATSTTKTRLSRRAGVEPEGARGDRAQAEDRQSDRPNVRGVAVQSPDHHAFHTGCLGLQSHQVTDACFIQEPAVADDQHVAQRCRLACLQEGIDAAGMPGGTDPTGQAAARHHRTHERGRATHWDLGA
jgi:hypothetical protein